jgi:hypothetical protein
MRIKELRMLEKQLQSSWITRLKRDLSPCWVMKATITNLAGAPDVVLAYKSKFVAIEFKIRPNKLTAKQEYEKIKILETESLYLEVDQFTDFKETLKIINEWCS